MPEWQGWSADQRQVDLTRVLGVLMEDAGRDADINPDVGVIVAELDLDLNAQEVQIELFFDSGLFEQGTLSAVSLSAKGWEVSKEFRQARADPVARARGARRALLHWRYGISAGQFPHTRDILSVSHSWFYGSQFSEEELATAADNLIERGYLTASAKTMGRVGRRIEMTARGSACIEQLDGDSDAMDRSMTSGHGSFTIGTVNNQGNAAFGSHVGSQSGSGSHHGSTVKIGHPAADLAAILQMVRGNGDLGAEFSPAAARAQAELEAAATGTLSLDEAIAHVRGFFQTLTASEVPLAAAALLVAAGDYAALQLHASRRGR